MLYVNNKEGVKMKYLLISLMIVILLRYVYELRYDYKDLIFILYYYAVMVLFGRNNLTMPIASMLLIHYLIELLNFRYVNLIMLVIELYFFLSTIVFIVIIDLIARQSKEKRLVEIENIELKNNII